MTTEGDKLPTIFGVLDAREDGDRFTNAKPTHQRKPSVRSLISRAQKAGKTVASITTPEGYTLTFGEAQPSEASNPWLVDIERATKQ